MSSFFFLVTFVSNPLLIISAYLFQPLRIGYDNEPGFICNLSPLANEIYIWGFQWATGPCDKSQDFGFAADRVGGKQKAVCPNPENRKNRMTMKALHRGTSAPIVG